MSKRLQNRDQRRSDILSAARKLFREKGIEETSMADIAELAGCARRTLYAYFQSWDELAMQVTLDDLVDRWEFQKQTLLGDETGLEKLRLWAQGYYAYSVENPDSARFQFFWDYRGFHDQRIGEAGIERLRATSEPVVSHMLQVFRQGQEDGSIRADIDVKTCMGQFAYTMRAIMNRALFPAESFADFEPDNFVNNYINLFLRGIARNPEDLP